MRLLLYSLYSVGILFTPELLCFGPCWKCAVQTTPDKCSVWLPTAQMITAVKSLSTNFTFITSFYHFFGLSR